MISKAVYYSHFAYSLGLMLRYFKVANKRQWTINGKGTLQKRNLKVLIWPPIHFVVKFNKHLNIKNLFVCTIMSAAAGQRINT